MTSTVTLIQTASLIYYLYERIYDRHWQRNARARAALAQTVVMYWHMGRDLRRPCTFVTHERDTIRQQPCNKAMRAVLRRRLIDQVARVGAFEVVPPGSGSINDRHTRARLRLEVSDIRHLAT